MQTEIVNSRFSGKSEPCARKDAGRRLSAGTRSTWPATVGAAAAVLSGPFVPIFTRIGTVCPLFSTVREIAY